MTRLEGLAKMQFSAFLHDNYGLDFIEGGALLGMLMELRQRDLISVEDLDGIDLKWGDVHAVEALVKKIVTREGIGDVLANGTYETAKYFAEKKGKPEIMNYPVTTHRYGQPAHDVRSGGDKDAMEYVTVCRPTEHTGGGTAGFKKGDWVAAIAGQNSKCATNSLVSCSFPAAIGLARRLIWSKQQPAGPTSPRKTWSRSALASTLWRACSISTPSSSRIRRKQWDMLVPHRWFDDPTPTGPLKGKVAYEGDPSKLFDVALPAYWKARGWTEDKGIPTLETLKKLGIDDIAADIAKAHL